MNLFEDVSSHLKQSDPKIGIKEFDDYLREGKWFNIIIIYDDLSLFELTTNLVIKLDKVEENSHYILKNIEDFKNVRTYLNNKKSSSKTSLTLLVECNLFDDKPDFDITKYANTVIKQTKDNFIILKNRKEGEKGKLNILKDPMHSLFDNKTRIYSRSNQGKTSVLLSLMASCLNDGIRIGYLTSFGNDDLPFKIQLLKTILDKSDYNFSNEEIKYLKK